MFWRPAKGEASLDFRLRLILWIPSLAYAFLLLGGKNVASLDQDVFLAFLGAVLGILLSAMFSIRQHLLASLLRSCFPPSNALVCERRDRKDSKCFAT